MALQKKIATKRMAALKGKKDTALLLRKKVKGEWIARLPRQAPEVDGETFVSHIPATAKAGEFIPVEIIGAKGFDLLADSISF
jgi:tRNA A37 methylthiotransferase MiaB